MRGKDRTESGSATVEGTARQAAQGFTARARFTVFLLVASVAAALAFPVPAVKYLAGAILGSWFVVLIARDLAVAMCLAAFVVPVADLTPEAIMVVPGVNVANVVLGTLLLASVSHCIQKGKRDFLPPFPLRAPLALLLLSALFSVFQSWLLHGLPPGYLLRVMKDQYQYTMLAWIAYRILSKGEHRSFLVGTVLFIDAFVAMHSVLDYGGGVRERSAGLIGGQPNLYGGFLSMQMPFFLAVAVTEGIPFRWKVGALGGFFLLAQALVLTGSRGAWVASACSLLVFGVLANRAGLVVLLVLALLTPSFLYGVSQTRFQGLVETILEPQKSELDQSAEFRKEVWFDLPRLVGSSFLFGQGFLRAKEVIRSSGLSEDPKATHSSIVTLAVEQGLPGLVAYSWMLFALFRGGIGGVRSLSSPRGRAVAAGMVGAIPALFVGDLTGERFLSGEIVAYLWIFGGILLRELADDPIGSGGAGGGVPGGERRLRGSRPGA